MINTNPNTLSLQSFVSIRKSQKTGGHYFRLYKDGVAYQAHSAESAQTLLKATGPLNKNNLVSVQRKRLDGTTWDDLQVKFPLDLVIRVDGDADGAKFCTILEAKRVQPMELSIAMDGVEKRVPNYGARRAAVATAEAEDADAPAAL